MEKTRSPDTRTTKDRVLWKNVANMVEGRFADFEDEEFTLEEIRRIFLRFSYQKTDFFTMVSH